MAELKQAIMMRIKESIDDIVRITFKSFQRPSKIFLCKLIVSLEAFINLNFSKSLLSGMFPNTVTPNTPVKYRIVEINSNQNRKVSG